MIICEPEPLWCDERALMQDLLPIFDGAIEQALQGLLQCAVRGGQAALAEVLDLGARESADGGCFVIW